MRQLPQTLLCVLVVVLGASLLGPASPAAAAGCENRSLRPTKSNIAKIEKATRCLLNRERMARGKKGLASSKTLRKAAKRHSRSMVSNHYFQPHRRRR